MHDIVIFGSSADDHVTSVVKHIPDSYSVYVLDVFSRQGFSAFGGSTELRSHVSWNRLKGNLSDVPEFIIEDFRREAFYFNAWFNLIRGFELNNVTTPLHDPSTIVQANNKAKQLAIAKEVGLKIPVTIVSNDADEVLRTIESDQILTKPNTSTILRSAELIFARLVSRKFLADKSVELSYAPQIFQEYVDKIYELRVNVIDGDIFALRIDSQETEQSKIDWRRGGMSVENYSEYDLPDAIKSNLLKYLESMSLRWGVFDFIKAKDGEYIFLECNPDGQWFNANLPLSQNISGSMAAMLCRAVDSAKN
ncbi:MAG: hypothetical protein ACSHX3_13935 [Litorimonas sp.]